jgi:BirA family transcriptional regulator, biotin operon repressor / biotin---[acetyl-CoA-carboxylase] ligase
MEQASVESYLSTLNLPAVRYFTSIGSTNDEAWNWVDTAAPHTALVVAEEQTAGRGRFQRRWITARRSALAISLVLRSPPLDHHHVHLLTGLGALAVSQALQVKFDLPAQIKWPNDVLLGQRKAAGVLVESRWDGVLLIAAVIGIGINIAPESVDPKNLSPAGLNFPATCVENELGYSVDHLELLRAVLEKILSWLPRLASPEFIQAWEDNLAYTSQWVNLRLEDPSQSNHQSTAPRPAYTGKLVGLTMDGALKLRTKSGELVTAQVGELHLRLTPPDLHTGSPD